MVAREHRRRRRRPGEGVPRCGPGARGPGAGRGGDSMRAILLSGGLALIISLVGTRYAIKLLSAKGYGQEIREDGPTSHHTKRGTPTMGGIVIILASVGRHFFAKITPQDLPSASAMLLLFLFVG